MELAIGECELMSNQRVRQEVRLREREMEQEERLGSNRKRNVKRLTLDTVCASRTFIRTLRSVAERLRLLARGLQTQKQSVGQGACAIASESKLKPRSPDKRKCLL